MLKAFGTIMVKKIVAAFKSRPVSQGSFGDSFTKFLNDPSKLGWLLKPEPPPAGADDEPEVCEDVVEEHCWDEGHSLESVIAGTAGGNPNDARALLWCCLDGQFAKNPAVVQAAVLEADDKSCEKVHEGSREAFGARSPKTQAGKCKAAGARIKAAQVLFESSGKLREAGAAAAEGFGAMKGRMKSIGNQLKVPLKLAKTLYTQFKAFQGMLMPLLDQLVSSGQKRRAMRLKQALATVVEDVTIFYDQFNLLKNLATDFINGGGNEQGSIQDMVNTAQENMAKVVTAAASDFGEALNDTNAGLTGNLNEATGDHGATETLENGVNAATNAAVKVADAIGDAASAAKKALLFKGAAFIADIEGFFAHLEDFVTAFMCFVGNKQGPGCAGDEEGEVASGSENAGSEAAQAGSDFADKQAAVYNAMGEDAVAAATNGVKAIGKAGQKAADTAKTAASNAANNVKSAATAEVAAIQAKVKAAFKEKLGLVYAMGERVGEILNPLKDCYDSVLKAIEVIKRVVLNVADIVSPDKSNTYVNNFNQLQGHVSDVRESLSSFRVNLDSIDFDQLEKGVKNELADVVTTGASIATDAVNGVVNVGKTAICETEGALATTMNAASSAAKTSINVASEGVTRTVDAAADTVTGSVEGAKDLVDDTTRSFSDAVQRRRRRLLDADGRRARHNGGKHPHRRQGHHHRHDSHHHDHRLAPQDAPRFVALVVGIGSGSESSSKAPKSIEDQIGSEADNAATRTEAATKKAATAVTDNIEKGRAAMSDKVGAAATAATEGVDAANIQGQALLTDAAGAGKAGLEKGGKAVTDSVDKTSSAAVGAIQNSKGITVVIKGLKRLRDGLTKGLRAADPVLTTIDKVLGVIYHLLDCVAIQGPKAIRTVLREATVAIGSVVAKINAAMDPSTVSKVGKIPDWQAVQAAKDKMKCVGGSISELVGLFKQFGVSPSNPAVAIAEKAAGLVSPVLDLLASLMELMHAMPDAGIEAVKILQKGKKGAGKKKMALSVSAGSARTALGALRKLLATIGPVRDSCNNLKREILSTASAESKVVSVMQAMDTGLGIVETALIALKNKISDASAGGADDGGSTDLSGRRRLLALTTTSDGSPEDLDVQAAKSTTASRSTADVLKELVVEMKEVRKDVVDTRTHLSDSLDSTVDQLSAQMRAVSRKVGASSGGGPADQTKKSGERKRAVFRRPGSQIKCPDTYSFVGGRKARLAGRKSIFQKNKRLLKESVFIPPSLTFGVAITVSIEVEVNIGMQIEFARCIRDPPTVKNCRKISKLFETSFESIRAKGNCKVMDVAAEKADVNPGAMYRAFFKSSSLAEQLSTCVRVHGSIKGRMEWTPEQHTQAITTVRWLIRNVKVQDEYKEWRKRHGNPKTEDGKKLEAHGAYCTMMGGGRLSMLTATFAKAETVVARLGAAKTKEQATAITTSKDEITVAVVPYIYASILAFAVVNLSVKVVSLEGELNLELFSVHVPISLYVSEKASLKEGATKGSPGMLIVAEPWVRSMSGRFFATITIFGKSFQAPAVDWTGLRMTLTSLCKGFGFLESHCGPSTQINNVLPEPLDPRRRPQSTGTCVPCFVNHDVYADEEANMSDKRGERKGFFDKMGGAVADTVGGAIKSGIDMASSAFRTADPQNSIVCPATPIRAVQFAGFISPSEVKDKSDIFNMGASSKQFNDGNNLGNQFFKNLALTSVRRAWSNDLIEMGYVSKGAKDLLDHIFNAKGTELSRKAPAFERGMAPGFALSICDEHVATSASGYTYTGTLVMFETSEDVGAKNGVRREGQDADAISNRTKNLHEMRSNYPDHEVRKREIIITRPYSCTAVHVHVRTCTMV
jgi:hypothetical protein